MNEVPGGRAPHDLEAVGAAFQIAGVFLGASPYGTGHINDTYASTWERAGVRVRYIHQRINHYVFKNPAALMDNVARVTAHLAVKQGAADGDGSRRHLSLIQARDGSPCWRDPAGNTWRTYRFIEGARTWDVIESPAQAFQAARAFGAFQGQLADLPGPRLAETIPGFHHTPGRFEVFERSLKADAARRAAACAAEVDYALAQKAKAGRLVVLQAEGRLPERITHNDTKLNNVMLDDASGEGICVIDLDTVMPGLAGYDFGDMVRTATSPAREDEKDLSKVRMQWDMFEALARGYLSAASDFLKPLEREELPFAGWSMTFECGLRFLADHLDGDKYFKVRRENQNLDRARTQFALARDIESKLERMQAFIRTLP